MFRNSAVLRIFRQQFGEKEEAKSQAPPAGPTRESGETANTQGVELYLITFFYNFNH